MLCILDASVILALDL